MNMIFDQTSHQKVQCNLPYKTAEFRLKIWYEGKSRSFSDFLYDLISKADHENKELLRLVYPQYLMAFEKYRDLGPFWENENDDYFTKSLPS